MEIFRQMISICIRICLELVKRLLAAQIDLIHPHDVDEYVHAQGW
jgi:hypothetical protein